MDEEGRELTVDEAKSKVVDYIDSIVRYWLYDSRTSSTEDKMRGAIFSLLVMIDGESPLPAMNLIPMVSEEDIKFLKEEGENWFPKKDLGGNLHELFVNLKK